MPGKASNVSLADVFGKGSKAASGSTEAAEPPMGPVDDDFAAMDPTEEEAAEAVPPDFATHAAEAFPELAGDDARLDALYRMVKSCVGGL